MFECNEINQRNNYFMFFAIKFLALMYTTYNLQSRYGAVYVC